MDNKNLINDLIEEGKKLVKKRPYSPEADLNEIEGLQKNEPRCHTWFIRSLKLIEEMYGKESDEYKIFKSLNKKYDWVNLFGTRQGELNYIGQDIEKLVSHLEAISKIQKDKQLPKEVNKKEFLTYLKEKNWKMPLFWSFSEKVKNGFCPLCKKPRTDRDGHIPGTAFIGGICYKCSEKLSKHNLKRISIKQSEKEKRNLFYYLTKHPIIVSIIILIGLLASIITIYSFFVKDTPPIYDNTSIIISKTPMIDNPFFDTRYYTLEWKLILGISNLSIYNLQIDLPSNQKEFIKKIDTNGESEFVFAYSNEEENDFYIPPEYRVLKEIKAEDICYYFVITHDDERGEWYKGEKLLKNETQCYNIRSPTKQCFNETSENFKNTFCISGIPPRFLSAKEGYEIK